MNRRSLISSLAMVGTVAVIGNVIPKKDFEYKGWKKLILRMIEEGPNKSFYTESFYNEKAVEMIEKYRPWPESRIAFPSYDKNKHGDDSFAEYSVGNWKKNYEEALIDNRR